MNIRIKVAGEAKEHLLELTVENYVPGRDAPPCSDPDHPDFSDPGDGAEFDVLSAWMIRGKKYRLLPRLLREKVVEDNPEKIIKELDR